MKGDEALGHKHVLSMPKTFTGASQVFTSFSHPFDWGIPATIDHTYLTVILQARVVYELTADEVHSTELAIRHIRRE